MRQGPDKHKRSRPIRVLLGRMVSYFGPFKRFIVIGAVVTLIATIIQAVDPLFLSAGVDIVFESGGILGDLIFLLAIYVLLRLASWGLTSGTTIILAKAQAGFVQRVQEDIYSHLVDADLSYHKGEQSGNVTSRVTSDTVALTVGIQVIVEIASQLILVVSTFIVLWLTAPPVALTALITVPVVILMTALYGTVGQRAMLSTQRAYGMVSGQIAENLSGVQIAKAFNREEQTSRELFELNKSAYRHNVKLTLFFTILFPSVQATGVFVLAAVLFVGAGLAVGTASILTIGQLFLGIVLVQRFMFPLLLVSFMGSQVQASLAAMDRISDVLEAERSINEADDAEELLDTSDGISFEDVTFGYNPEMTVLSNVSFKIEPGETVAIVGETGAGKTTIASLINRFYDPQDGRILIGNQDIKQLSFESLREAVSLVAQEPYLFDGTVLENMVYGHTEANRESVIELCELSMACEFIDTLPDGYDTKVVEGGKNLSAGQRQMITIVRTLVSNPRILILDEATSRLDAYSESLVQHAQAELFAERTTLVIAHRLSTIANADRILVFDKGKLVESGTHQELLERCGIYKQLYDTYYAHQGISDIDLDVIDGVEIIA